MNIEIVDQLDSTQDEIKRRLSDGRAVPQCLLALDQTKGRGRFGREWVSNPGDSLTMTLVLPHHPKPWLLGFQVALAAAATLHTRLQWPNDLTIRRRKVGGILTEIVTQPNGEIATIIGVGINLNQESFPPEISDFATSLWLERGVRSEAIDAATAILERFTGMDPAQSWTDLSTIWLMFDDTPGKIYKLLSGEIADSLGIGPEGELICAVDGETQSILAAEALFGQS